MADPKRYITNPSLILEGFFRQETNYSVFQNKTEFKVKVLSEPEYLTTVKDAETGEVTGKRSFKGRILDPNMGHEKFLPDPSCDPAITSDENFTSLLSSLHVTVYVEEADTPEFGVGSIVTAFIEPGTNNNKYDLQYMRYLRTDIKVTKSQANIACLLLSGLDFDGAGVELGADATERLQGYNLLATLLYDNVLENIRKNESGDKPNVYNGGSTSISNERNTGAAPKTGPEYYLVTRTFEELRQMRSNGGVLNGINYNLGPNEDIRPFALGLYQIIPSTLRRILEKLPELNNLLFTRNNQGIAAAYLIGENYIMKNYLLGKAPDTQENAKKAAHAWAKIWAYAPSQYDLEEGADGRYPSVAITRGDSYYSGEGNNKSHTDPNDIIQILKAGRESISASGQADLIQQLINTAPPE